VESGIPQISLVAYGDGVGRLRGVLGIRLVDAGAFAAVLIAVEIGVATGGGPGARPLNLAAYLAGAVLVIPVLFRHKWPLWVLVACSVLLLLYYIVDRRNISPAPLLCLPLYDAAVAGYLAVAIAIPVFYMSVGLFVVDASTHQSLVSLASEFLPSVVVLALAIMLGEVVRGRRALAAETADRLRLARVQRLRPIEEKTPEVAEALDREGMESLRAWEALTGAVFATDDKGTELSFPANCGRNRGTTHIECFDFGLTPVKGLR